MAKKFGGQEGMGGLHALSVSLHKAANVKPEVRRVIRENAKELAKSWKELHRAQSVHGHARHYPKAIGWSWTSRAGTLMGAEIGPNKDSKQGPLGNLVEFGSKNNIGWNHIDMALNWQEPKFLADMREVALLDI